MGIGLYRLYRLFRPPYNCTALTEKVRSDVRCIRSISERPLKHVDVLSTTYTIRRASIARAPRVPPGGAPRPCAPRAPAPARAPARTRRYDARARAPSGPARACGVPGSGVCAAGRGPARAVTSPAPRDGEDTGEDRRMWGKHTNSTQATHTHTHIEHHSSSAHSHR